VRKERVLKDNWRIHGGGSIAPYGPSMELAFDEQWAVYTTYRANMHVGLLNLWSPDVLSGGKL